VIKFFVKKPLFTISVFIILLLLGIYSLFNLPIDLLPNISVPTITIITSYPGASPDDIEITVSKVIEDAVATVPNIDKITSDSIENLSTVTISFKWGTNIDAAAADVRDKLDLIKAKLPKDANAPIIYKFDTSQIPVLVIGLSADQSYGDLYQIADKTISTALKKIQGVGSIIISGGLQRQINVDVDRYELEAYKLSMNQINLALQGANISLPSGTLKSGGLEYGIRVPGEFNSIDEISNLIVGYYNGAAVYLKDVANVSDSYKDPENFILVDNKPGIMLLIQKQSNANTVQVAREAKKQLNLLKKDLPPDITINYVQDISDSIVRSINELTKTLYWAIIFIVLCVLFFLRDFKSSFIISMAIPLPVISVFQYMFLTGSTINIVSLASIIISVGIVVDDAIVLLENIHRHMQAKGEPPQEAAIYGAGEVFGAVLGTSTTNVVIFIPLLLVQGFVGVFFNQLSLITIVIITMSFFTSVFFIPMLSSILLDDGKIKKNKDSVFQRLYDVSEKWFLFVEEKYKNLLGWAVDNWAKVILFSAVLFIFSMPLFMFTGTEFFPEFDNGILSGNISLPAGTRLEETKAVVEQLQEMIKKQIPEVEFVLVSAGTGTSMGLSTKSGPNYGRIYVRLVPLSKRNRGIKEIQKQISDLAYKIPGLKSIDFSSMGVNSIMGGGRPITLEIYGSDFDKMDEYALLLKSKIEKIPGVLDPLISREKTNPEYRLKVDRDKSSALGLSMYDIALSARSFIYGSTPTKLREKGDEYDIFVRLNEKNRSRLDDIKNVYVTNRLGSNVSLGNIASISLENAPQVIQRKNQQRLVIVDADYYGRSLGDITSDISKILRKMPPPQGVSVKIAGSSEQIAESFRSLFIALFLGIALIYLVLVAQFESLLEPFIIMFSIPLAIAGVVWALIISGYPFGVMAFVGLILVMAIAVKNSIVLIDFINILRERGLGLKEAIMESGKSRLRPILMTSFTTGLALFPIIFGHGEGSEFWKSMAVSVLGGLTASTSISLVFVPVVYYITENYFISKNKSACQEVSKK